VTSILWFRRDLRLGDLPALHRAAEDGPVLPVFLLDDRLRRPSGAPRLAFLYRSLRELDADLQRAGGHLVVRRGNPTTVLPKLAREIGASSVHVSADFGPYGRRRDEAIEDALPGAALVRTGSPYAVSPGRVVKRDGDPFTVFSAFYRAWCEHGWRDPAAPIAERVDWVTEVAGTGVPKDPALPRDLELPAAGESAALRRWEDFRRTELAGYADGRDRPDEDGTSRMSVYLKYGNIHPRTLLAGLAEGDDAFRRELAWRDFYASVLFHFPASAREYFRPELERMTYASSRSPEFDAWKQGRTGYPLVDAGMRQLLAQAWMHNRVRMIVASFLVKDLHIDWRDGARYFMQHLVDGDLASNNHGWQWVAGSGTDPAPFFRIFNPVTQGQKFDPHGDYVRRFVPELRGIEGAAVHAPWELPGGVPAGYPERIVDHATERRRALADYQALRR
jgi:deoxyribodipyrimidine photo-lyase